MEYEEASTPTLVGTLLVGMSLSCALSSGRLLVPLLALSEGYSMLTVGILSALFAALPAFGVVPYGRLMDRAGVYLPVMGVFILTVAAAVTTVVWPHTPILFVVAPLIGFCTICGHVGVTRAIGAVPSVKLRTRNVGYLALCYSICQFIGPVAGGQSFEAGGPRLAFTIVALMAGVGVGVLLLPWHRLHISGYGVLSGAKPRIADLLHMPALRPWVISSGSFSAALTSLPFIAAIYCREIGLSAVQLSWIIGAAALGAVTVRLVLGKLTARVALPRIVLVAMLFAAAGYILMPVFTDFRLLLLAGYLLGLGTGAGMPVSTSLIYTASPPNRVNEAIGLGMAISAAQQVMAPLVVGLLANIAGVTPAIWFIGLSLLVVTFFLSNAREG